MEFLCRFRRVVALMPEVVCSVDSLPVAGVDKRESAVQIAAMALGDEGVADRERFRAGLGLIVSGVVTCLNASLWSSRAQGRPHA